MQRFDCLSLECPLLGPHLLEASAGTGKTFSIEHIFVRLLLQGSIELEEILAVTFTRAATRELKKRIRDNLQKALNALQSQQSPWPYLVPYFNQPQAISRLRGALETFDHCQIFTIHGFCYRMLREFAFEANLGFALSNPDESQRIPPALRSALEKFWKEELKEDLICPEQMGRLMKEYSSMKELSHALLKNDRFLEKYPPFSELLKQWESLCETDTGSWVEEEKLLSDFSQLSLNYKKKKGDFVSQISALCRKSLRELISEEGSIFTFLSSDNLKVRIKPIEHLHYPHFFDWARKNLFPLIQAASDRKRIFAILANAWYEKAHEICMEENHFQPDELLRQMRSAIEYPAFKEAISKKYQAVIVDEFQDTDPLQWEIFQHLFLSQKNSLKALFLVGDPKQSIYRFRSADVYTYFEAREFLGEKHLYHLDTNFRSSKNLIEVTNALFERNWLPLPKIKQHVPYHPVQAGLHLESPLSDGKGAIHWVNVKPLYIWAYAVQEIERLSKTFPNYSSFAILVKDRYQAQEALSLLQKRGIPAKTRSHSPLGQTEAFQAIKELLHAVMKPRDAVWMRRVSLGPFAQENLPLSLWKSLLEEEGLVPLAQEVLRPSLPFYADARQVFEELFSWEHREGFSLVGLERFLDELEALSSEEGGRRRMEDNEEAVQILTIHISKGLEFDVVFAFGLAFSASETDEEIDAEKLRQLYVAMTRAKYRLYVPSPTDNSSPMALFCQQIQSEEGPLNAYFEKLGRTFSLTYEEIGEPIELAEKPPVLLETVFSETSHRYPYFPSYLHSFTSLATHTTRTDIITPPQDELPLGSEVGVLIHQIFETLFSASKPIWRDRSEILKVIQEELRYSPLKIWEEKIYLLILQTLALQLPTGFSLSELEPSEVFVEMEFYFHAKPHVVKGFIDLVFSKNGKTYFVDWKTNWIGEMTLEQIMDQNDYWLQASLYQETLSRYLGKEWLGGAFYFFIRQGTFLHFIPEAVHGIS